MTGVLIAGIGNIFFGDDGFGVEVIRRLDARRLPEGARAVDYGIRGVHLAYDLLDGCYGALINHGVQVAAVGTVAEGMEVDVVMEPTVLVCRSCGHRTSADDAFAMIACRQ